MHDGERSFRSIVRTERRETGVSGRNIGLNLLNLRVFSGMWTTRTALPGAGAEGFSDDLLDGPGTAAALCTAAEAAVDLLGRTRQVVRGGHGGADVVIGQYVTGTDDHGKLADPMWNALIDIGLSRSTQRENRHFQAIPNWRNSRASANPAGSPNPALAVL
jgi:hypothetical protein